MSDRLGALSWSFPCGRLFLTQIRVSPLLVLAVIVLMFRLGWQVGAVVSGILFLSILLHEFGHVFAARLTGGMADEILIWPLGGLAAVQPGPHPWAALQTIAAGPLVNLTLALLFFPGFYAPDELWGVLNPAEAPVGELHAETWGRECLLLIFFVNWLLLLLNLLPVFPLDGGQMVSAILSSRMPNEAAFRLTANVGMGASILLMVVGLAGDWSWVLAIGSLTLVMNVLLSVQLQTGDSYDDSFMGYDFSQGYTSLERSGSGRSREPRPSWLESWKARRRERQQQRELERREDLERQLDELLAKVHEHGLESLTASEKRLLRRASDELRHRSRPQEP
ncbi:MAG: M50 family metallopeptidase [Planctomycetaceae bacterium]|nr:M50 family metallopeptidase [Planctomycetaceae bacterium]